MKKNIIQSILVFAFCSFMLLVSGFTAAGNSLAAPTEQLPAPTEQLATPTKQLAALRAQCFWMENTSGNFYWVPAPWAPSKQDCYAQDSCSGGLGQSGGGCYKWAIAAQAPGEPWK